MDSVWTATCLSNMAKLLFRTAMFKHTEKVTG